MALVTAFGTDARAHTVGASRLAIEEDRLALVFAAGELGALYPLHDLGRATPLLVADTWDRLDLAVDGVPCEPGAPVLRSVEGDGLALEGTHGCAGGGTLTIVAGHLQTFEVGHETEIEVDGRVVGAVDRSSPIVRVPLVRERAGPVPWWGLAAIPVLVYAVFVGWKSWRKRAGP